MSCQSTACTVFVSQACLTHTTRNRVGPRLCDQMNAKGAGVEKTLLSCDVTAKVLVKCQCVMTVVFRYIHTKILLMWCIVEELSCSFEGADVAWRTCT